jgi:hypothetical protein
MDIEKYFLAILLVGCVAFVYFAFKHVRDHEKSDSKRISTLTKPKKRKK